MLAASITTDGEWQQLEAKCSVFVTSPIPVCYPSILLQKPSHIKQWKRDTSLFLPACCTEVPHFFRWQLKMESCRLNPAFIPNHPLQEATVGLPDGDKLNVPNTFMCPLSATVCLGGLLRRWCWRAAQHSHTRPAFVYFARVKGHVWLPRFCPPMLSFSLQQ